ncbi:alkene reductase [Alginatibacterium sediminis]|uniref:Alkene reductase n=1 Tax=Alginatibacterium sediminis TaxID=2164068 RepID=A0A420EGF5_9ALTE|nr:alkene reductase [Alginatibacterium sediminis]RKF19744.1 alkene reductase [Alginatibacterium sediminis]
MFDSLFNSVQLGELTLKNRIVMPPMTRSRASQPGDIPNEMMARYYAQRASAGLIIAEGMQISELGKGYAWTPGIYSPEQVQGWKRITKAVHDNDGCIFAQIWHVGRVTHFENTNGQTPISSSALKAENVRVFIDNGDSDPGFVETVMPRAMNKQDIKTVIGEFKRASQNALDAGFDGVELHAANGYLVNQFIDSQANNRSDEYGGSLDNRLRFLDEVVTAMVSVVGPQRVGVRLAPLTTLNGTVDDDPIETYTAAAKLLNRHNIAYLHIAEADWDDAPVMSKEFKQAIRDVFDGIIIYAGKYTAERAQQNVLDGFADMIAFGRPFIANPDLPKRIALGRAWNTHQPETLFGGGVQGLTDYPYLED